MTQSPFLESIRYIMRSKHYSIMTEKAYLFWIKRFILFNNKKHPKNMGELEVTRFLTYLAVERNVAASTQTLALCAIVFMYKHVFERELTLLPDSVRARKPKRVPSVLSHQEAMAVINALYGKYKLMFCLLYGSGLRKMEMLQLRIKDIDFDDKSIFVSRGKGDKDRVTILPEGLQEALSCQIDDVRAIHEKDLAEGEGKTSLGLGGEN